MSKKMKKNYLICLIAVAIGFLLLCLLFDTGILGKKSAYFNGLVVIGMFYTIIVCSLNLLTGYMGEGKPTAVSKKFSGNTLKDAEGKDIVF